MKWDFRRLYLIVKNSRIFQVITVCFLYLLLPLYQYSVLQSDRSWNEIRIDFFNISQAYVPLIGLVWLFLIMKYLFEDTLEEIHVSYDRRSRFRFCIYLFIAYQGLLFPLYIWYIMEFWNSCVALELCRLFMQTLFVCLLFYNCVRFCKNVVVAFMISFLYMITMLYFVISKIPFNIYSIGITADKISGVQWGMDICLILIAFITAQYNLR